MFIALKISDMDDYGPLLPRHYLRVPNRHGLQLIAEIRGIRDVQPPLTFVLQHIKSNHQVRFVTVDENARLTCTGN
jgi:hypothetical protein